MRDFFIETPRLYFSTWGHGDLDNAVKLWGDSEVTRFISHNGIFTKEQIILRLNQEIENQACYNVQYWPIFAKNDWEIIGCCGFRPYKDEGMEFGIHIRSAFWRMKYAYEAGSSAIEYCWQYINPVSIVAGHNPNNTASKELLLKLGFVYSHNEYYAPTGLMHPTYFLNNCL